MSISSKPKNRYDYTNSKCIGEGAFGKVYKCYANIKMLLVNQDKGYILIGYLTLLLQMLC